MTTFNADFEKLPAVEQLVIVTKSLDEAKVVFAEKQRAAGVANREFNEARSRLRDHESRFDKVVDRIRKETAGGDWEMAKHRRTVFE